MTNWDESKHPRVPSGTPTGGEFSGGSSPPPSVGSSHELMRSQPGDRIAHAITDKQGESYNVKHSLGVNSEHIYEVSKGDKYVGEARLSHTGQYVVDLGVKPEFRHKGIAASLYNHIEKQLGHPLVPSPVYQTEAGQAFWKARRG